jgi:hypothetical protein
VNGDASEVVIQSCKDTSDMISGLEVGQESELRTLKE